VRANSAFYRHPTVSAAIKGGAEVSVAVRLDPGVRAAITQVPDDAWSPIKYTDAIYDEQTPRWVSRAEVSEPQLALFDTRRLHKQMDIVAADRTHRQHTIVEQVHTNFKYSALDHLPPERLQPTVRDLCSRPLLFNLMRVELVLLGLLLPRR